MRKYTHKVKERGLLCMNVNITKQKIQLAKKNNKQPSDNDVRVVY
jgi:hypothetical protein